jgi:hypothetical protein
MIKGREVTLRFVENGIVATYREANDPALGAARERVFYQFDDLVQWLAQYVGATMAARWEPRDPRV